MRTAAERAAERTARAWRERVPGRPLLADAPELERASAGLDAAAEEEVRAWQGVVFDLVREEGAAKRTTARLASLGVNGAGLTVMLAVFAHTGGLTGAEVVVAGGTSAVGQKVLEAIFGDQAVRTLAARAREDLVERVDRLLRAEAQRFHALLDEAAPEADTFAPPARAPSTRSAAPREQTPRRPTSPRSARRPTWPRAGSRTPTSPRHAPSSRRPARGSGSASSRPSSRSRARPAPASRSSSTCSPARSSPRSDAAGRRPRPGRRRSGATARTRSSTGSRSGAATSVDGGRPRRARPARPARLRFGRDVAPCRVGARRRPRRPRALGGRAAEVRRRLAARPLPAPARDARGRDGGRPQPGRLAPGGRRRARGARTWSGCSNGTACRSCRSPSSPRGRATGSPSCGACCAERVEGTRRGGRAARGRPRAGARRPRRRLRRDARTASGRRTGRGCSRRSRRPRASRPSCAPSPTRTGAAARSRPAGRSCAGSSASGPIRCAGSACPSRRSRRCGPRCRRPPTCSAPRWRARRAGSPTARPRAYRSRGPGSRARRPSPRTTASPTGSTVPSRPPISACRRRRWWRAAGLLQSLLALAVLAGAVWLTALGVLGWLRIEDVVPLPEVSGIPIPTWLLLGGAAVGILLAFLFRLANGVGAKRRARRAGRSLREQVEAVADELVLGPVERELVAHADLCAAVETAWGRPRARPPRSV